MTAKEYYNNQDRFEYFTKLTNTGVSDDFDEIMAFAEAYHEHKLKLLGITDVSGSLRFSEREVDFAYLCGVFNTSGIDGLHAEIQRLKELGKEPHDIIEACR